MSCATVLDADGQQLLPTAIEKTRKFAARRLLIEEPETSESVRQAAREALERLERRQDHL